MVVYIDVLRSMIVDCVLRNVDARGMICNNRYVYSITKLWECVEVLDCSTRCYGKCHIFCFHGRKGNGLLFLRQPGYCTAIYRERIIRYGRAGITTKTIVRVREAYNRQKNPSRRVLVLMRHRMRCSKVTKNTFDYRMITLQRMRRKTRNIRHREG